MELTGLALSQVLTIFGGFAAAVTVLYLLKLRRRQVEVPFVQLWHTVIAEKRSTRLFSALKRLFSWLLALAVVAALALAMGDPRYKGDDDEGRTTVVLIDASASMQATDVEGGRLAAGRREVERLIEGIGSDERMLVAQMDATTVPLGPLSSEPQELTESLARLEPTDVAADLGRGLRFALDVLRNRERPRIVIVSDGVLSGGGRAEEREIGRAHV